MRPGFFHRRSGLVEIVRILGIDGALPGNDEQFFPQGDAANREPALGQIGTPIHQFER